MIEQVLLILLALGIGLFIALPFLGRARGGGKAALDVSAKGDFKSLDAEKESVYTVLLELEFDHKMGKLSQADFDELDAEYRAKALAVLQRIEALDGGAERAVGESKPEQDEALARRVEEMIEAARAKG